MTLEEHYRYAVPASTLISLLTDKTFYRHRYHMDGDDAMASFDVWEESPNGLHLRVCKWLPVKADKLPAFLRRFVKPEMPLYSDFVWQLDDDANSARAACQIWMEKIPLRIEGRIVINGQGDNCEKQVRLKVTSHLPLVGKKMLEKARPQILRILEEDHQATLANLQAAD